MENMGFSDPELPKLVLLKYTQGNLAFKYGYNKEKIDLEGIRSFVDEYQNYKLSKQYFSAPLPIRNEALIKDLVGLNFQEQIKNTKKDILVFLY